MFKKKDFHMLSCIDVLDNQGWIGLISYMGEESIVIRSAKITYGNIYKEQETNIHDEKLLKFLIENHHTSPFEHMTFTFIVHCPLFIKNQWMRHRTWSYSEISRRYTSKNISFYNPNMKQMDVVKTISNEQLNNNKDNKLNKIELVKYIENCNKKSLSNYKLLLEYGVSMEIARCVLTQSMMVTFFATVNLHNLIKFIQLRKHHSAQKEIREYACALLNLIKPIVPIVSKYI